MFCKCNPSWRRQKKRMDWGRDFKVYEKPDLGKRQSCIIRCSFTVSLRNPKHDAGVGDFAILFHPPNAHRYPIFYQQHPAQSRIVSKQTVFMTLRLKLSIYNEMYSIQVLRRLKQNWHRNKAENFIILLCKMRIIFLLSSFFVSQHPLKVKNSPSTRRIG